MPSEQINTYQTNAVTQAEPVKLVELLLEGAIRFIHRAEKAITDGDMESAHNNILRAYAIVSELIATLDFEQGGEIAKGLEQCYDYILYVLREANIKKDHCELDKALDLLEPLLAGWQSAFSSKPAITSEPGPDEAVSESGHQSSVQRSPLNIVG